jgi:hypothetical protein
MLFGTKEKEEIKKEKKNNGPTICAKFEGP